MANQLSILYTSCLCSKNMEQRLLELSPKSVGLQIQKYHRLLAKGFSKNGVVVDALSYQKGIEQLGVPNMAVEEENDIHYTYLANSIGSYQRLLVNSFLFAFNYFKHNKNAVMICDVLNFTVSFGATLAARIFGRKVIGIITDFPEQLSGGKNAHSRLIWKLVSLCTDYVVLTDQMKERLNPKKHAIVLEGHVDSDMVQSENTLEEKYKKKVCMYAGMLHKKYGVEKLVKAFLVANVDDSELHIYGDGDYAEELETIESDLIKYYGIAPNNEVVEEEMKATLLINPRPIDEEFTKYSFPSKNLEYMVSGTPLLTTKLPGMPEEYLKYVYTFEDETVIGMSKTIKKLLELDARGLYDKGKQAKDYVLQVKNNEEQAKKIIHSLCLGDSNA